jgi:hypothetical protein
MLSESDDLSYEDMNRAINGDVQGRQYPNLHAARTIVLKELKRAFDVVPNKGVRLLRTPTQINEAGEVVSRRLHRIARKGVSILDCADQKDMTQDERITHDARMAGLAVIAYATKRRSDKKLLIAASKAGATLEIGTTLEALRNGSNE